ncbi:unnamed protein product [Calicophoron daubneyi]|uniref:Resistance to inhibitors of cholinesterase protein 3 N-terminal domain-containing protein n=1 Tax=Calicophoron daubneyi TaxID=300641 RepID=A0AAV2U2L2_CALDB
MPDLSIQIQTYVVLGVMIGCFAILYPRVFHPLLMHALGLSRPTSGDPADNPFPPNFAHHGPDRPKPSIKPSGPQAKRGGVMSLILPIYGIGIVIYLVYTLSKIYKSKRRKTDEKKDEFLRHYYRDFRYDADRGKFRMGQDSSEDEDGRTDTRVGQSGYTGMDGSFDWAAAYGMDDQPNIYRSAKSLPRDLEELLMKMETEDTVNSDELTALRVRLEQTEQEMTRLLHAMDNAEHLIVDANKGENSGQELTEEEILKQEQNELANYMRRSRDIPDSDHGRRAEMDDSEQVLTASEGESDTQPSHTDPPIDVRKRLVPHQ